jgi:integrase
MATVETRTYGDGRVVYRVRFRLAKANTTTGKAIQSTETFTVKAKAERFAKLVDAVGPREAVDRLYATAQSEDVPSLNTVAADHIRLLTGIEEGTRLGYTRLWSRTWAPLVGDLYADQLTADTVREAVNTLAKTYSTKSLENQRGLLSGVVARCIELGYLTKNPAKGVRLPEGRRVALDSVDDEDDAEMVCMTHAEWDALYDAFAEHYRPFLRFLVGTGCRWGEAVVLRPSDFDLDAGLVRIRRALKWSSDGNRVIGPPKTKKGKRTIKLAPENVADLRLLFEGKKARDYVFTQARGGMLVHRNFWSRYWKPGIFRAQQCETHRAELEAVGCKCGTATPARCKLHRDMAMPEPCGCSGTLRQSPRIHDLRHTHASWLLANGVPIHVVQARLGHESIQTTVDTYSHLLPDAQLAAAAAASLAFSGTADAGAGAPVLDLDALDDETFAALAAVIQAKAVERGLELGPRAIEAA